MKQSILFFLSLFIVSLSFGQVTARIGKHEAPLSWTPAMHNNFASSSEAKYYAQEIIDAIGLKPNFEVIPANVDNAAAVVYGGKRYVLYNPNFINALVQKTGNKWAAISVLAHEIGHHLNGHTVGAFGSQPAVELEADEFSGFVLRKLGASLSDAQAAMKVLAGQTASRTHPAQYDRLASIAKGWNNGGDKTSRGGDIARVPQKQQESPVVTTVPERSNIPAPVVRPVLSNRNIIGDVRFSADPNAQYYVTSQYNLVKVNNNSVYTIGKLSRLNSRAYPFLISDDNNTELLVDARGAILKRMGDR